MKQMKQPKFTFKTTKPTGKYKSFFSAHHTIKLNKASVGTIEDKTFKIKFMIIKKDIMEDGNPNCDWKWVTLAKQNDSLEAAKEFLNANCEVILKNYSLKLIVE